MDPTKHGHYIRSRVIQTFSLCFLQVCFPCTPFFRFFFVPLFFHPAIALTQGFAQTHISLLLQFFSRVASILLSCCVVISNLVLLSLGRSEIGSVSYHFFSFLFFYFLLCFFCCLPHFLGVRFVAPLFVRHGSCLVRLTTTVHHCVGFSLHCKAPKFVPA